ncbi:hypothetical protein [Cyanobium sp. PCC 7001]|uniref:hypothetical protein n=1 Tax=Cyanobium sp. PCC 7001 TaxID=180281 RepID=UPI0002F7070F|nr:hypothetical protein [Cyanobium sp. PCC 7001]
MNTEARLAPLESVHAPRRAERSCSHCGGSGILRLDDQRFRTCLECLGQGRLPVPTPRPTVTPISAAMSSSAA